MVRSAAKALQQRLAVAGASVASLLGLDDAAPDDPVRRGHDRVDGARNGAAPFLDDADDVGEDRVVADASLRSLQ